MGLTGQKKRACVNASMRMGCWRGGGDDGGCHGRYITAAAKLMYHAQRTHVVLSLSLSHTLVYRYIFIYSRSNTHLVELGRTVCLD
jgi:hypothetical protein